VQISKAVTTILFKAWWYQLPCRPRCGRYHGVVAMSPYNHVGKASFRIRGATVLPRTICVVDRGAVGGSEIADLRLPSRTLTWPRCRGGAEPGTRPFATAIGGDVDLGTLAAGNDGIAQRRRRCREASCRTAATAVQWYGRDCRPPRPRFPPCMVPCSGCRVSI
jgi:hypothetical protein